MLHCIARLNMEEKVGTTKKKDDKNEVEEQIWKK